MEADPDDDAARLVYADWLLERGDRRGELIMWQCRQADPDRRSAGNGVRIEALLRDEGRAWAAPWPDVAPRWAFERGLLEQLIVPLDVFVATARALLDRDPLPYALVHVRVLSLLPPTSGAISEHVGELAALLAEIPLRLTRLRLHHAFDEASARVLAMPLATLRSLSLWDAPTSVAAIAAILEGAPRLRALGLESCGLDDIGATMLAPHCRAIEQLTLAGVARERGRFGNPMTEHGARSLVAAAPSLARLMLRDLAIDGDVLQAAPRTLVELDISSGALSARAARELGKLAALRRLDVHDTPLDDDAMEHVAALPALESLTLRRTAITHDAARTLLERAPPTLARLALPERELDPDIVRLLEQRFILTW